MSVHYLSNRIKNASSPRERAQHEHALQCLKQHQEQKRCTAPDNCTATPGSHRTCDTCRRRFHNLLFLDGVTTIAGKVVTWRCSACRCSPRASRLPGEPVRMIPMMLSEYRAVTSGHSLSMQPDAPLDTLEIKTLCTITRTGVVGNTTRIYASPAFPCANCGWPVGQEMIKLADSDGFYCRSCCTQQQQ